MFLCFVYIFMPVSKEKHGACHNLAIPYNVLNRKAAEPLESKVAFLHCLVVAWICLCGNFSVDIEASPSQILFQLNDLLILG